MYKALLLFLILILFKLNTTSLYAQQKFEKETRLREDKVPEQALSFLNEIQNTKKVKWFLEEGLEKKSIEAKFKANGTKYSIEFDLSGNIEDVEQNMKWERLAQLLKEKIHGRFASSCASHKVIKLQVQYLGSPAALLAKINANENFGDLHINYEIVVKCKSNKSISLYEYLFNDLGEFISSYKLIFNNSSHLEY